MERLGEKCGVFGVFGRGLDASRLAFFGLFALQHRGQESSGIASSDGERMHSHKRMGLVAQAFTEKDMQKLVGHMAIGHNRYSTSKNSTVKHAQPAVLEDLGIALVHNGNLPSTAALETFLKSKGVSVRFLSDSEMMLQAIGVYAREGRTLPEAVAAAFPLMTGAFSLLIMDKTQVIALRDSYGIRPLSVGTLNGGFVFSSETCAFHPIGAEFLRDVAPGEMVIVDEGGLRSERLAEGHEQLDIFEFVYFARPDSHLSGKSVYGVRENFGKELAKEFPYPADVVIPVPETGIPVALGYAKASGVPFETGLIKNRYIHRTFIEPEQHIREQGVKIKLTPLPEVLAGKRVIIIDDSIVRGTTSRQIVKMLFEAGAREVDFLISCPPVRYPDFYGIDTPKQEDLLASKMSVEEMRAYLGATRLGFLSYEGLIRATGLPESNFCTSCFTGRYPIDLHERAKEVRIPSEVTVPESQRQW
ncbi:amidophosphoribosyltransferase [Patescibacteria group bacterium]|nr:amidophosphoribosyltransferase [Patescibacteria group bacterium]